MNRRSSSTIDGRTGGVATALEAVSKPAGRVILSITKELARWLAKFFAAPRMTVALWLSLACVLGCSDNGKSLVPVSGHVTLDRQPLAGGSVVFQPVAPSGSTIAGKGSAAFCDAQGRFQLETTDGKPGAIVGDHRVRIYGPRKGAAASSEIDGGGTAAPEMVPEKYNYATTLTFVVVGEGTSEANFDLTTK